MEISLTSLGSSQTCGSMQQAQTRGPVGDEEQNGAVLTLRRPQPITEAASLFCSLSDTMAATGGKRGRLRRSGEGKGRVHTTMGHAKASCQASSSSLWARNKAAMSP